MCGYCRDERWKYFGFKAYWGKWNRLPWKRKGEGDPNPGFWIAFWRFDILLLPFHVWDVKYSSHPYLVYLRIGPLEFNYLPLKGKKRCNLVNVSGS